MVADMWSPLGSSTLPVMVSGVTDHHWSVERQTLLSLMLDGRGRRDTRARRGDLGGGTNGGDGSEGSGNGGGCPLVGDCGGVMGSPTLSPGMMKALLTGLGKSSMGDRAIGHGGCCLAEGGDAAQLDGNRVRSQVPGGVASADGGGALVLLARRMESL